MGQSPRDEALESVYRALQGYQGELGTREDPYGVGKTLDELTERGVEDVTRRATETEARTRRGVGSRLASRGITGGTPYEQAVEGAVSPIHRRRFGAIRDIRTGRMGQAANLATQRVQDMLRGFGVQGGIAGQMDPDTLGGAIGEMLSLATRIADVVQTGGVEGAGSTVPASVKSLYT